MELSSGMFPMKSSLGHGYLLLFFPPKAKYKLQGGDLVQEKGKSGLRQWPLVMEADQKVYVSDIQEHLGEHCVMLDARLDRWTRALMQQCSSFFMFL